MATYAFTTTDSAFTLSVNSVEVGTWDKADKADHTYKVDITGPSVILSLNNPYYSAAITGSDTVTIDEETQEGTIAATGEAIKDAVFTAGGAVEVTVLSRKITLTHTDLITLGGAEGIEIVPAPGAGKAILVDKWILGPQNVVADYTNTTGGHLLYLTYGADWQDDASAGVVVNDHLLDDGGGAGFIRGAAGKAVPFQTSSFMIDNIGVYLQISNGGAGVLTGGNAANTLTINVFYSIIDL